MQRLVEHRHPFRGECFGAARERLPQRARHGLDSLFSIVPMPAGVPVATVAIGHGRNDGLLAVRILATSDPELGQALLEFKRRTARPISRSGK